MALPLFYAYLSACYARTIAYKYTKVIHYSIIPRMDGYRVLNDMASKVDAYCEFCKYMPLCGELDMSVCTIATYIILNDTPNTTPARCRIA